MRELRAQLRSASSLEAGAGYEGPAAKAAAADAVTRRANEAIREARDAIAFAENAILGQGAHESMAVFWSLAFWLLVGLGLAAGAIDNTSAHGLLKVTAWLLVLPLTLGVSHLLSTVGLLWLIKAQVFWRSTYQRALIEPCRPESCPGRQPIPVEEQRFG